MTRHPGQEPGIVPQVAADRVQDGEPDATCLDFDEDLARDRFGTIESLPHGLGAPGVDPESGLAS